MAMEKHFFISFLIGWISICSVLTYGPIPQSNGRRSELTSTVSPENNILSFGSYPSPVIQPVVHRQPIPSTEEGKSEDYWWLRQDSPFSLIADNGNGLPSDQLTPTNDVFNYQPPSNKPKQNCADYNCVPEVRVCSSDQACVPKTHCTNLVVSKNTVDALSISSPRNNKYCSVVSETCCKVIITDTSFNVRIPQSFPSEDAVSSVATPVVIPSGSSYNVLVHSKDILPVVPTLKPEPSIVPYTGPLNTTPYPGCPAALKCVPEHYCTIDGVMTAIPVVLTKDLLERRVPLTDCLDSATGIIGKCCRDPDYKDPWPDHDHSHNHDHEDDKPVPVEEHIVVTESSIKPFTIKKPIGGFTSKPSSFVTKLYQDHVVSNTHVVLDTNNHYVVPSVADHVKPVTEQPITVYQVSESIQTPLFGNAETENHVYNFDLPAKINPPTLIGASPSISPYITISTQQPSILSSDQFVRSSEYTSRQPIDVTERIIVQHQPSLIPSSDVQQSLLPSLSILVPPIRHDILPSIKSDDSFSQCGQYNIYNSEVGVPWYSSIIFANNKTSLCDGVIVAENAILTSAHCLDYISSQDLEIQVGSTLSNIYVIKAAAISRHPQYDTRSYRKDVALIFLKQPITFSQFIHKICLPSYQQKVYPGECYVSSSSASFNDGSQNIKVQIFPYKDCENRLKNSYLGKYFVLGDGFTCVSALTDSGLCQAKIGSPIICNRDDGHYELYGTKSWDLGCQDYKKFSIFSDNDVSWIQTSLNIPIDQLYIAEQSYLRKQFKGETLEEVVVEKKPGFALGYGK